MNGVVDRFVRPSGDAQAVHIASRHTRWIGRQLVRKAKQRTRGVVDAAGSPVIHALVNQLVRLLIGPTLSFIVDLGTEIVRVFLDSVTAPVSSTDDHGEHLALCPAQR